MQRKMSIKIGREESECGDIVIEVESGTQDCHLSATKFVRDRARALHRIAPDAVPIRVFHHGSTANCSSSSSTASSSGYGGSVSKPGSAALLPAHIHDTFCIF